VTPLADTNGDGVPDTGSIDPAGTANIVVKVFIAAGAEVAGGSDFTINAASVNAPSLIDPTTLNIEEVRSASVDIATNGQLGNDDTATADDATAVDDDDATAGAGVAPGAVVVFPIDIGNMRPDLVANGGDTSTSVADTYNLSITKVGIAGAVSVDAAPFTVQILKDADADGVVDTGELVDISDTGWLPAIVDVDNIQASEIFNVNIRVQVPVGTPAGLYYIDVTATSTNNSVKSDTMRLLVKVNETPSIQVLSDNTITVIPGGSYIFSHTVVNTGNAADTVTLSYNTLPDGYTAVWVDCDTGAVVGTGNPSTYTTASIPSPATGVDNTAKICLKVFVPADAPAGTVLPITVTADMNTYDAVTYPASIDTALDIITVIDGALQLVKTNTPTTSVAPGGTITYRTTYKNLSSGPLAQAVIADAIPANVTLVLTDSTIQGKLPTGVTVTGADDAYFQYSINNGVSWKLWSSDPTAETDPITNIRFDIGNTSNLTAPGGSVPAGEDGWFEFQVIVK